ncbi:MAG: regulator of sigma E protease [Alphaproteobacteria bacterium]|jgi:regulator of sigma E protease
MDILHLFSQGVTQFSIAIIGFVILMSIVVFIHEFGHYYVARLCGVKVLDFSIGFGKKILSRQDKHGTNWSVSLIPMGGYVKFSGDRSVASEEDIEELSQLSDVEKKETFYFKSIWQKMAIIIAGPLANIILCFLLMFSISFFNGVFSVKPIIENVIADRAASRNGLQSGDVFTHINGRSIESAQQVKQFVSASFGDPLNFIVLRNNKDALSLSFAPDMIAAEGNLQMPMIGVVFSNNKENVYMSQYNIVDASYKALQDTIFVAEITGKFFKRLFLGRAELDNISGPLKIGDAAGSALQTGFWQFILLMALISMSIGLVNLLPVPMLDGGHLFFYMLEVVGLKANSKVRETAFKAGFILVIMVMIFTVINDIITIGWR